MESTRIKMAATSYSTSLKSVVKFKCDVKELFTDDFRALPKTSETSWIKMFLSGGRFDFSNF